MEFVIAYFIYGIIFAIGCGYLAKEKGKDVTNWNILGFLLGFIALLIIGLSQKNNIEVTKKCPYCAELIKQEAIVCRFCNADLPSGQKIIETNAYIPLDSFKISNHNQEIIDEYENQLKELGYNVIFKNGCWEITNPNFSGIRYVHSIDSLKELIQKIVGNSK